MEPSNMPKLKKIQDIKTQIFICLAHSLVMWLTNVAESAEEKIIDVPTYPKYKIGGWIANAGSCKIGFKPNPSWGVG